MELSEEQILKAAEWWADRVCHPKFSGLSPAERQDRRNDGYQMAEMLMRLNVKPVSDDQRKSFVNALKEELSKETMRLHFGLHVDYGPCEHLSNAAKKAGVPLTNFPIKTSMCFSRDGSIQAACGYGAAFETL